MGLTGAGRRAVAWLALAACLGLFGAACDQFHVQSGLLSYPDPWLWDQAAWVPLNFAVLLTGLVLATIPLTRFAAARGVPDASDQRLLADLAWFVGAYGVSGLAAPDHPEALAIAYVAVWVVRIAFREERAFLYPFGVTLALAGCLVEAAEIELGWFSYEEPDVIGVPFWLAGIYLHGAPLAFGVARRVDVSLR
jgi:hypothetical protein